jgi:hypothetical protein
VSDYETSTALGVATWGTTAMPIRYPLHRDPNLTLELIYSKLGVTKTLRAVRREDRSYSADTCANRTRRSVILGAN